MVILRSRSGNSGEDRLPEPLPCCQPRHYFGRPGSATAIMRLETAE
jgi:hypothetical protein